MRNPAKMDAYKDFITIIQWDATNSDDVAKILSQVDILVHAVSVPLSHKKPTTLYSQTTQAIIDARPHWTATKLIVMSSTGTHQWRKLPWPVNLVYEKMLWDVADDKEKEEKLLEESSLPRIVVKSPMLTNGSKTDYSTSDFATYKVSVFDSISRKTIASCIIDVAWNPAIQKKLFVLKK